MSRFKSFVDEADENEEDQAGQVACSSATDVSSAVIGRGLTVDMSDGSGCGSGDLELVEKDQRALVPPGQSPPTTHEQADGEVQRWRQRMVNSLKQPWQRKQQQPSWDSARTVELLAEEHITIAEQRSFSFWFLWWWNLQGYVLAVGVGLLCYLTYVFIEIGVGALSSVRFGYCQGLLLRPEEHCPADQWHSWPPFVGFIVSVCVGTSLAATSAYLVFTFAPAASGSGIPEVKTILNGFVLPDVVTFRTLAIKVPGLVLAVASGMSLGHEGPMVHVAVCWAHILSRLFPQFHKEGKKREILSASVAAGIGSAFGTPVGGVLFSLEEASSQFPSRTLLLAFVASVSATLALSFTDLFGTGRLTLYNVTYKNPAHPSEYAVFALLGIMGGLVGAVFNTMNIRWNAFRMRPAFKKTIHPINEVATVAFFTLVSSWPLGLLRPLNAQSIHAMFENCISEPHAKIANRLQLELGLCHENGESSVSHPQVLMALGAAAVLRFLQTVVTIGIACPAGLFVPSLFIGSCLGRFTGGIVKAIAGGSLFPHETDPGVYSMVGAAAVLGGVSRMTISLVVIMLELTNGPEYVVAFMLAVLIAKAVGDSLNEGIYDLQIVLKGYPFLHEEMDITFTERCCDIMEHNLTKLDLDLRPSPADIRAMLTKTRYNGFPVVNGQRFEGYAERGQLENLLREIGEEKEFVTIDDMRLHTDSTVMRMVPDAPLTQAHQVFKQLGCRHIFVVGSEGPDSADVLLGMLSKKSFLGFLKDGKVGHMRDTPSRALRTASVSFTTEPSASSTQETSENVSVGPGLDNFMPASPTGGLSVLETAKSASSFESGGEATPRIVQNRREEGDEESGMARRL
eukprot:TRINITY_DN40595_c0_g2_i1.p1 TRINITY_DN40595_c0_g2~~TRINITY_DN40595_c0_g2_i1.p1  ORF type:complete len:853 (+),score=134.34 TRINITY_DN40595_c0_g2_i1:29-2587(+)